MDEADNFVIFPSFLQHDTIAFKTISPHFKVVSAGFFQFEDGKPYCFGRSHSLNLESRPEDSLIILNKSKY